MNATLTVRTFYSDDPDYVTDQEFTGSVEDMEASFNDICDALSEKGYTQDDTFKGEAIWNRIHSKWMEELYERHIVCVCLWNGN